jgi:hypothetical protein
MKRRNLSLLLLPGVFLGLFYFLPLARILE